MRTRDWLLALCFAAVVLLGFIYEPDVSAQTSEAAPGTVTCLELTAGTAGQSEPAMLCSINTYTTVPSGGDARLPDETGGQIITVFNLDSADSLTVYPRVGEFINAGAANAPITLPIDTRMDCIGKQVARVWSCTFSVMTTSGVTGPTGPAGADGATGPAGPGIASSSVHGVAIWCDKGDYANGNDCCAASPTYATCMRTWAVLTAGLVFSRIDCGDALTNYQQEFQALCY